MTTNNNLNNTIMDSYAEAHREEILLHDLLKEHSISNRFKKLFSKKK